MTVEAQLLALRDALARWVEAEFSDSQVPIDAGLDRLCRTCGLSDEARTSVLSAAEALDEFTSREIYDDDVSEDDWHDSLSYIEDLRTGIDAILDVLAPQGEE